MSSPNDRTPEETLRESLRSLGIDRIVTICGSTRFMPEMAEADIHETAAGRLVLKPGCDMKTPHPLWADPDEAEALKLRLDDLHRAKIRLADEVLIVAPGGYIGDSTRAEIAYAEELGKPVRYWDGHAATVTHELVGEVGLTESERTVLRHALDLAAAEMETYTDAEVEAHASLCRLADPDEMPEADRG